MYDLCKEVSEDLITDLVRMNAILRHYFPIPFLCKRKEAGKTRQKKKRGAYQGRLSGGIHTRYLAEVSGGRREEMRGGGGDRRKPS